MSTSTKTTPKTRRTRGRPPLPRGEVKGVFAAFKLSKDEDKTIRRASRKAGMDRSAWMRTTLLSAAARAA